MGRRLIVDVLRDCTCEPCVDGKRWFYCTGYDARVIAQYAVTAADVDPDPEVLKLIYKEHPGCALLWFDDKSAPQTISPSLY